MDELRAVTEELERAGIDGWLIYDFRGSNGPARPLLRAMLGEELGSRRVFLYVPRRGQPVLLAHAIEAGTLSGARGVQTRIYSSTQSLDEELRRALDGARTVAMDYSPGGDNPYVGTVDAGTVERVRGLGVEVVSAGDIAQVMQLWSEEQLEQHLRAADVVLRAKDAAFGFLGEALALGRKVTEAEVQKLITDMFAEASCVYDHAPNVSFGAHAGDPHHVASPDKTLQAGEVVLIDLWCKVDDESAPYADVTWMGHAGPPTPEVEKAFAAVRDARDAAFRAVVEAYGEGRWPTGAEVDRAARRVLTEAGYADAFTHRTGHSIGTASPHGLAAHLDDYETRDERLLRPGLGFTIEPGVYLEGFGVRSEINVYIDADGPHATTDLQAELEVLP
ncbi:MAG TPA: M24 family metallopeptidase [Trueperaceae bacterium]|nr:M24 family metallopeptidase [Trueperaceae bacterium]